MRSAARTARSASSSCETGAPKTAMTASPMNFSTVPPKRSMSAFTRSWYGRSVARTSSGSARSERSVKPTRSTKRTETTFRSSVAAGASSSAPPQPRQKRARSGFSSPHAGQTCIPRDLCSARGERLRRGRQLGRLVVLGRLLVLREPPLQDAARKHSDQPPVAVDDGDALEILLLQEAERVLERNVGIDGVVRRLGDLAKAGRPRIASRGDDLPYERLSSDHTHE